MKNALLTALASGTLALLLLSCAKGSPTGVDNTQKIHRSTLRGKVVDKDGLGILNVIVRSNPAGHVTVTDSGGNFTLPDIEAGDYTFQFIHASYRDTASGKITLGLADDVALSENMVLVKNSSELGGQITDINNNFLPGVGIAVEKQGVSTLSFSNGRYVLKSVEPGTITVFFALQGVGTGDTTFYVLPDSTYVLNLRITKVGGTVSGQILNAAGQPEVNAQVSAMAGALKDTTNSQGQFSIPNVPGGLEVELQVVTTAGDTSIISNVSVADQGQATLAPVTIQPPAPKLSGITLTPVTVNAKVGDASATLVIPTRVDAGVLVLGYDWDRNGNGVFREAADTLTIGNRLDVPLPNMADTLKINVRAFDRDDNFSSAVTATIFIVAVQAVEPGLMDSLSNIVDTLGTIYGGTYTLYGADSLVVVILFPDTGSLTLQTWRIKYTQPNTQTLITYWYDSTGRVEDIDTNSLASGSGSQPIGGAIWKGLYVERDSLGQIQDSATYYFYLDGQDSFYLAIMGDTGATPVSITIMIRDFYPVALGKYWIFGNTGVTDTAFWRFRTEYDKIDVVNGSSCYRLRQRFRNSDTSSTVSEWTTWFNPVTQQLTAFGGSAANGIDSASIFPIPLQWHPTGQIGVGHKWSVNDSALGGLFSFELLSTGESVTVPAGQYSNCIKIHTVITNAVGDTTQRNDFYYARNVGEVLNDGWSLYGGAMRLELQAYKP